MADKKQGGQTLKTPQAVFPVKLEFVHFPVRNKAALYNTKLCINLCVIEE